MAKTDIPYPPDDLDFLKQKRKTITEKIDALEKQILELKEKDAVIAKKIFEREDGRLVKAAKELMLKDPDVKAAIDHILEKLEYGGVSKRGRPAKAAPNSTANFISAKIAGQQQGAATPGKK
jgi:hypothetical protein